LVIKNIFRIAVNRVAAYKELDTDLFQHAAFAKIEDISLRLLTTVLTPEADLKEVLNFLIFMSAYFTAYFLTVA